MSDVQLNDRFFQETAGWEVVKLARFLVAEGRVLSSSWKPPLLNGVVQSGETTYRAGLVIKGLADVDNLCTCRQSREDGTLCPHSVAVGIHWLKPAVAPTPSSAKPPDPPKRSAPSVPVKDPVRLDRDPDGETLSIQVLFPPNFGDAFQRGKVQLVFEGVTARGKSPLSALVKAGPFCLKSEDESLLQVVEPLAGGDTPGMLQVVSRDLAGLLPALVHHPRLTLGRQQSLSVVDTPVSPPLRAELLPTGEIRLVAQAMPGGTQLLMGEGTWWVFKVTPKSATLAPLGLTGPYRSVLQRPLTISRAQIPQFIGQEWPRLSADGSVTANFQPSDFSLEPQIPRFRLELTGGLAQLTARLQCVYGARVLTVGVSASDDGAWLPDPERPTHYLTRDPGSEQRALARLRQSGFQGPNTDGRWQMNGQERVLNYFVRDHPRFERDWDVSLEERLERSTRQNIERITPEFKVTSSGQNWFELEVSYGSSNGTRFSAADVQQLLQGNGTKRMKNGRTAVIDPGLLDEFQQTLVDCAPQQQGAGETTRYRVNAAQGGFLKSTLEQQGLTLQAPENWRNRMSAASGEARLECPPLGPLESVLRPYQKQGVAWITFLRANGFGGVLADEMGLGKTLQVLAHLAQIYPARPTRSGSRPSLVVCPTSLVFNWVAEATRFVPHIKVLSLSGPNRHSQFARIPEVDLVVTSYALIRRDLEHYPAMGFDTVVLDEAQHIKNRDTQNAQAVKSVRADNRLVLSGTPLENSVLDLWSVYDFLMPGYLGSAKDFRERYEVPIARERDVATMSRLSRRIRPFLLRRLKRDVVQELPAKIEQITYCELTPAQAELYQQVLEATRREVLSAVGAQGEAKSRMLMLTALLRLRQVCCDLRLLNREAGQGDAAEKAEAGGKLQVFSELLDEIVDGGHRVLVFSQFTSMLALLKEYLDGAGTAYCYLDGATRDRQAVVQKFQNDSQVPVFLISLKAGGTGLNLTGADTVIHFDPWWNPAVEDQATDRAHRIGQSKVVTSFKLITRGTVEEKILALQQRKRELVAATLTGEEAFTGSLSWDELQELLQ